ncbi:efflux transporter outer membrane subunit [Erythrobacter sp. YT30]|uniref:efflux transporter outer membrane subunit n=1 Tax=Erythrobacter sp. YT30 TaxID=1735012 RepID=UPI00076C40D2|nr:efflux transporter outer membrane subunit [Erythrobacter sp. YT30]KWV91066.1 transporter [Erythrobacter sp. YT30]
MHRSVLTTLGLSLLLGGCISLAPDRKVPAKAADMPSDYRVGETSGDYRPEAWWSGFEDPVLDALVDQALRQNLDIAEAVARVEQASAQARLSRAALLPTLDASGGASFSSTPLEGSAFGDLGGGAIDRIENETFTLSAGAAYELDLFGRARNDFAAARRDALATRYDLQAVRLAASAETISAYFDVVDTRRQIELTLKIVDILEDRASRTDDRFQRGLIDSFELYQIRQELRSTQASLPQLESGLAASTGRLAVLLGTYPDEMEKQLAQALMPRLVFDPVPLGLPADLLDQRPDVAAAWARLDAARLRIGARKAERFPRISLSGSLGTQGGQPEGAFDFADNWTTSLAASIVAPIFDGGRISANIRSARAVYDQNAAAYARTVITAFREVDSAIADYEEQRQRYILIAEQLSEARSSLELQRNRFAAGVGSYTACLDALRTVYQVEASLSSAARATALARLGIHRALGGDWAPNTEFKEIDMRPAEEPAMKLAPTIEGERP